MQVLNVKKIFTRCCVMAVASTMIACSSGSPEKAGHHSEHANNIAQYNAQYCSSSPIETELDLSGITLVREQGIPLNYQGFNNIEGPLWYDGALYYSNIGAHPADANGFVLSNQTTIWRWVPGTKPQIWLDDTQAGTNGLALGPQAELIAVRHSDGSVAQLDWQTQVFTALAKDYEGKRFNSPNDLTVSAAGSVYFTDPNWDTPSNIDRATTQGGGAPGSLEQGQRVYRIDPQGHVLPTLATQLVPQLRDKPNGIMLSFDQKQLIVAGLQGLWVFDLNYGRLSNPKRLMSTAVDGLGKDCSGNIYVTTTRPMSGREDAQFVVVLNADYEELGSLNVSGIHIVTNVAFGGDKGKTLFVTGLTAPINDAGTGPRMCGERPCLSAGIYTATLNVAGFPN